MRDILKDAIGRDYDAGISLEPHMVVVFHDAQTKANNEDAMWNHTFQARWPAEAID